MLRAGLGLSGGVGYEKAVAAATGTESEVPEKVVDVVGALVTDEELIADIVVSTGKVDVVLNAVNDV